MHPAITSRDALISTFPAFWESFTYSSFILDFYRDIILISRNIQHDI